MFFKKKKEEETKVTTPVEEKKEKTSAGSKVIKLLATLVVLFSFGWAIYSSVLFIKDSNNASSSADSYITLNGKNTTESKKVFEEFGTNKQKKAADFALVGTKFFISETKITPDLLNESSKEYFVGEGNKNFYLYNLTKEVAKNNLKTDFANNIFYLDLNDADEGDYLIYSDAIITSDKKDINPYSLLTNETIYYTSYTLPNSNGLRKKITIRNNEASPFLLINLKYCGSSLPTNHYDLVIFYQQYDSSLNYISDTREKTNIVKSIIEKNIDTNKYSFYIASSIQDAYNTNAIISIAISDSIEYDYTSIFTIEDNSNFKTKVIDDSSSPLINYDYYPEIRELTGYLDKAGENYKDVTGNDIQLTTSHHVGKESFMLQDNSEYSNKINNYIL